MHKEIDVRSRMCVTVVSMSCSPCSDAGQHDVGNRSMNVIFLAHNNRQPQEFCCRASAGKVLTHRTPTDGGGVTFRSKINCRRNSRRNTFLDDKVQATRSVFTSRLYS
ncbi:hypothetical protein RR46_04029 [Papilio xuthus]|uniref:Uncharacterized protein n=1 Tax=Papilio xuthus TaxID=66420 RepID=A0A194QI50_PAPXU|nr:hypothetical protein RR46_04029 [Papilio xuthus]